MVVYRRGYGKNSGGAGSAGELFNIKHLGPPAQNGPSGCGDKKKGPYGPKICVIWSSVYFFDISDPDP